MGESRIRLGKRFKGENMAPIYVRELWNIFPDFDRKDLVNAWEEFSNERYCAGFMGVTTGRAEEFREWCISGYEDLPPGEEE